MKRYSLSVIRNFGDRETEKIWKGERSKRLPGNIQQVARRKLRSRNADRLICTFMGAFSFQASVFQENGTQCRSGEKPMKPILLALALALPGVANALEVDANGPYDVAAESTVELTGSVIEPCDGLATETYQWDVNADGDFDDPGESFGPSLMATFDASDIDGPDQFEPTFRMRCQTQVLTEYASDIATVNVANVDPTIDNVTGDNETPSEGDTVNYSATITDPEAADTHTYEWTWNDGSASTMSSNASADHLWSNAGMFNVSLVVTDDDGGSDSTNFQVEVSSGGGPIFDDGFEELEPPLASNDTGYVYRPGVSIAVPAPGILANDTPNGHQISTVDGQAVGTWVNTSGGGRVNVQPDGGFTYEVHRDANIDGFTYMLGTGKDAVTADVTITPQGIPIVFVEPNQLSRGVGSGVDHDPYHSLSEIPAEETTVIYVPAGNWTAEFEFVVG